ncbi:protein O-linked-mannose beta-1,2-N-acetylglucosaminyltransferase 1-like, partial [Oppia nitens]|uniref:protein O-linked-mannose beta-1,2-N-acetylglucosaminyltransferase 1-like n=1 Tax=Oppia nitens TaxID=1686743 RepID=UPI0023DC8670
MGVKLSGHSGLNLNRQFLYIAKWALLGAVIWIITILIREVEFVHKINEPTASAPNEDEVLVDISQTADLLFPQDLSFTINEGIKIGDKVPNCGLPLSCDSNHFAVHLFTGKDNQIFPKLCIDGQYLLDKGVNGCGRGINLVVIDNITRSILRVSNFDTYEKTSQPLETLLLTLRVGDIIIMISFDESTAKLSKVARLLMHQLGSNWAQNLIYRSSWYIITQKGINGYTPYENLNLPNTGGWADSHEIKLCVPLQINGIAVQPDPILNRNPKRLKFCSKYSQEFPLFCEGNVVNDPLTPARILKYLPISNEIVRTPIIVITGPTYSQNIYLSLTLETLIRQPGITSRNVIVFYDNVNCPLIADLAEVFDFMSNDLSDFGSDLNEILRTTELLFPDSKAFILIDMNTILAPDFIPFMGQLMPFLLVSGSDIEAISAWNDNGFDSVSNDTSGIYRANGSNYMPRFAAMFRRGFAFNISSPYLWSFGG